MREKGTYLSCSPLDAVFWVLFAPLLARCGRRCRLTRCYSCQLVCATVGKELLRRTAEALACSIYLEVMAIHALSLGLVGGLLVAPCPFLAPLLGRRQL